jgi:hypothetical protein
MSCLLSTALKFMDSLRKSTGLSPKAAPTKEVVVPALLAAVLRQHSKHSTLSRFIVDTKLLKFGSFVTMLVMILDAC